MHSLDHTQVGAYHVAQLRTQARRDADARLMPRRAAATPIRVLRSLRSR